MCFDNRTFQSTGANTRTWKNFPLVATCLERLRGKRLFHGRRLLIIWQHLLVFKNLTGRWPFKKLADRWLFMNIADRGPFEGLKENNFQYGTELAENLPT